MPSRIVYISWPAHEVTGGIKIAFKHVEILRELGYEAIVATTDGQRPKWFETPLEVHRLDELRPASDILVLPENYSRLLKEFANWPNRKVVLFQGLLLGLRGLAGQRCYSDYGVTHLLCAGHQAADYCRIRFPKLALTIVPVVVDGTVFRPQQQKLLQIAYLPRKRPGEAAFIVDLFRALEQSEPAVGWVEINNVTERELANALAPAALYLALPRLETCGLTTLEAMACGCVCVGFTGGGGRDYAHARNGFWVEEDACMACVQELRRAVEIVRAQGEQYQEFVQAGLETAHYYRRERLAKKLHAFWQPLV